jgi:hypothetical protein
VIECYRLADHYKQNPEVFLTIPLSAVQLHIHRTVQLMQLKAREQHEQEEPD